MPGYVAISSNLYGTNSGSLKIGPFSIAANTQANLEELAVTLVSGANTITVPSWAAGAVIVLPTANTQATTLKGVSGDTGIALSPTLPGLLSFPVSPPASFVLTSAGNQSSPTVIVFF